jgi:hypothetical protein
MRRSRQSQSPSDSSPRSQHSFFGSKNKRRTLRKDSVMTDGDTSFSSSGASDSAPWRVGRYNAILSFFAKPSQLNFNATPFIF